MYAFPNVHDPKTGSMTHGMTLRDYFAAKAMQAIMERSPNTPLPMVAHYAYVQADAMLKARDL